MSTVSLVRVVVWSAVALVAPLGATAQATPVDSALTEAARALVAERWALPLERIELDLGAARDGWTPGEHDTVTLVGSGRGGNWLLRVESPDGSVESLRVRAGVRVPVTLAAHALQRGQTLSESDIRLDEEVRWGQPPSTAALAMPGWEVQRAIREGDALRAPAVRAPMAVHTGRPVRLLWNRGGVRITVAGTAVGTAGVGDEVRVRTESGERLSGVVIAPGVVNVSGGAGR